MNTIIDRTDGTCMQLQCGNHCPLNCILTVFLKILNIFCQSSQSVTVHRAIAFLASTLVITKRQKFIYIYVELLFLESNLFLVFFFPDLAFIFQGNAYFC